MRRTIGTLELELGYELKKPISKQVLLKLIEDGKSTRFIGKEFNLSQTAVRHWLKKFTLKTKPGNHKKPIKHCKSCGEQLKNRRNKFCNNKCSSDFFNKQQEEKFKEGKLLSHGSMRRNFMKMHPHQCMICKLTEWQGQKIPLVLDHIDGNSENNSITNFRLICCNCDAQLPTFKGKNKGNGRAYRRERYKNGLSY